MLKLIVYNNLSCSFCREVYFYLSCLQESEVALILDESSSLDVSPGLVGDLHHELPAVADHHVEDVQVHCGPRVVNVGDEAVLLARLDKLIQKAGVEK